VQDVISEIGSCPSTSDEQLRNAIAAGIHRDPLCWNYAIQVNLPIHTVVEHGRVTLRRRFRSTLTPEDSADR